MNLSADINKEELEVFLEEADEQLKLLDEDFIMLEKSGNKPEILQEIFRAAHTIKGSSAMLGYEKMSQVAHAMETVLDKMRNNTLEITTPVVDALLSGLDILKSLRDKLISDDGNEVDISVVTAQLAAIAGDKIKIAASKANEIQIDKAEMQKIQAALDEGNKVYKINIAIDSQSSWTAVRQFQIIAALADTGEVIRTDPSRMDIEACKTGPNLEMVLASSQEKSDIRNVIDTIAEIISVHIDLFNCTDASVRSGDESLKVKQVESDKPDNTESSKKPRQKTETVRVDIRLLDNLMNLVGEMVIDRNRIRQISRKLEIKYGDDETVDMLRETSIHMFKLVSDLQENILRARMLHIGTILNGFPRLVRDLAQKANKKIDFVIEGQETELDRSIIEQIRDPLLHLLRNAVDHGIESPEVREKTGKPEKGTIKLSAYHEQNHIVICVSDDGGGIDTEKVKQKAIQKGFKTAEEVSQLSHNEALNLILLSGLSTAEKVTEVSGRGVGMDVVKTNVEGLGGSLNIHSALSQGTTFKIRLPLTLATIDGILVSSGGLTYVVPISAIVEIVRLKAEQIQSVMGKSVFRLRENIIPLIWLNERFDQGSGHTAGEINIVVIKVGDRLSGLAVDAVMEPQESVVKSLGKYIGNVQGISGATIMGDGQVALILDTATLIENSLAAMRK